MPLRGVTVAHLGHYDPGYARNRILVKALGRAGAGVVTITDHRRFAARTPRLICAGLAARPDVILVGFPGHSDAAAAKLVSLARGAPVIWDALTSLWETAVIDRRNAARRSPAAYRYWVTDRLACALADTILSDTNAHIAWFSEEFRLPERKFRRIWVGADDELMRPCPPNPPGDRLRVVFYGTFIPLHGVEHILGAAERLEGERPGVTFVLCGSRQTYPEMRALAASRKLSTVEFVAGRSQTELHKLLCDSDVCLGIFGTSTKAQAVVPNKVFDALACGRPVITADTPAARECLADGETACLCPPGDADGLATAIATLQADPDLRDRLARAGHSLFQRRFSLNALAEDVAQVVLDTMAVSA